MSFENLDTSAFASDYKIQMPLSGIASSWFQKSDTKEQFAYLDYDVKISLKWKMTIYSDKEKKNPILVAEQKKLSFLAGQAGFEFRDAQSGEVLGAWVPKRRLLNIFLRAKYNLVVDGKIVAVSPGEGFFKLFVPRNIRKIFARGVKTIEGAKVAKIRLMSVLGCGSARVIPAGGKIENGNLAMAVAVLAAICGLQDN